MTTPAPRLVKVSFSCLMCGLDTPEIEMRVDGLSRAAVRRALDAAGEVFRPLWDPSLVPHCPRCRGRLLLELHAVPLWRQLEVDQRVGR